MVCSFNDQPDPSVPEDENGDPLPPGPNPNGSDATVEVTVPGSRFSGNGNTEGVSVSDNDGLRVNEGGLGDPQTHGPAPRVRGKTAPTGSRWTSVATATR